MHMFNAPNLITLLRIALIPLFVLLFFSPWRYAHLLAAALFLLLSLTDFIDGYLARKRRQVTDFGKLLDPIADKLLISTALVLLIGRGVEWWMALIIIIREVLLTALRLYIVKGDIVIAASWLGKLKTVSQIVAITAALIGAPLVYWLMLIAVVLTLVSGIGYLVGIRKATGNEIINVPNTITFMRMLLLIPLVLLISRGNTTWALVCFTFIVAMDKLDGISASLTRQRTKLGEILDSFTDWLILPATFFVLILFGYIDRFYFGVMLLTSALFAASKFLYVSRSKDTSSTPLGKLAVGLGYISIFCFLLGFVYRYAALWVFIGSCYLSIAYFFIFSFIRRRTS
ncbi:TPA: CDP-diacylglycerol--glycerol-3-phosphate 3-phosphatidyltransferase [Candidatus Woesearchaeota archaeon]|nr:CDP-diacylglycerol--glycerol-3-phosphate 3-phosphatidyltransferase [Candidatus Woesearchaeota archaeon]